MTKPNSYVFSDVWNSKVFATILNGSCGMGLSTTAALWVCRLSPQVAGWSLVATVIAGFGSVMAAAVWLLTFLECQEWLTPWEDRASGNRKVYTTPWRAGTSMFALLGTLILFYYGPSAAMASIRNGYVRNPASASSASQVARGDSTVFWLCFLLTIVSVLVEKLFAVMDPSIPVGSQVHSRHRLVKYAFVIVIACIAAALTTHTVRVPGLLFAFMPALLGWFALVNGPLQDLANEYTHLRRAFFRVSLVCISRWLLCLVFCEGIIYSILVYLPSPPAI